MSNVMSMVKLKNHTSRNGFDLSRKNAFTAKIGELLPVACVEVLPGDTYEGEVQHFTRTMPVNTAAYTRVREYYDWFFVPTNLLWNKFNTFVTQMSTNNQHARSIISNNHVGDTHPYFTNLQVHEYIRSGLNTYNNMFGFNRRELTAKLLNYLGYGDFTPSLDPSVQTTHPYRSNINLNPFPLLAYQKIYSDYFRNSQWEQAYAPAFNLDYITGDNDLSMNISSLHTSNNETMFDLRYCNWNKDKFMGLLPSAQYGASASIVIDGSNLDFIPYLKNFITGNPMPANANLTTSGSGKTIYANGDGSARIYTDANSNPITGNFSILALRQAEALQKWKEITHSQQQDYKSQIEAHFGVSMEDAYSERCRYIDGSVSNLDISEVTNTNITGSNGADIAGKGVGVGRSKFQFKSQVHGYLMCIYHAVPLLDYSLSGVNRMNQKTKVTDYAIPEFDQSGMVSVPTVELTNNISSNNFTPDLLGYAPRYYDYKTAVDEVHGAFMTDLSHWVAPVGDNYINTYLASVSSLNSLNYVFFKVNPATLNPIFAQDVDSSVSTDQLLVNANFDLKAVRNLDRNGLPY